MADETEIKGEAGKAGAGEAGKGAGAGEAAPKPEVDRNLATLVARERELEAAKRELEGLRTKTRQHEQAARKTKVLDALYTEFPGLSAHDVRGAALVAADDGLVDLHAEDPKPALDKLKEILAARAKATKPALATSIGGTPGTAGKGPAGKSQFLI